MASSRVCGFEPQQRRFVVASNKYLINCLVLVQPDFEINQVLNSIIIMRVRYGVGGRDLPLNGDVWSFGAIPQLILLYDLIIRYNTSYNT